MSIIERIDDLNYMLDTLKDRLNVNRILSDSEARPYLYLYHKLYWERQELMEQHEEEDSKAIKRFDGKSSKERQKEIY